MSTTAPVSFAIGLFGGNPCIERATETDLDSVRRERELKFLGDAPNPVCVAERSNDLEAAKACW